MVSGKHRFPETMNFLYISYTGFYTPKNIPQLIILVPVKQVKIINTKLWYNGYVWINVI